jgi:TPR repeat protein
MAGALMLDHVSITVSDLPRAAQNYRAAADGPAALPAAACAYGLFAEFGRGGVEQSAGVAAHYYARAAAQGHAEAARRLRALTAAGVVPREPPAADYSGAQV